MATEDSTFAEFHDELRSVAADLLAKDREIGWPVLAEAGWTGLEIAEEFGGAGAGFTETAVVCEEIGRAAASTGYLGTVLAVGALNMVSAGGDLLTGVASGDIRPALVLDGFDLREGKLYGTAEFVPDAAGADRLLIVADGVVIEATGLTVTPQPVVDETRNMATVSADGQPSTVLGPVDVQVLRDRAAVAVACDSLGLAQAMLDATVSYVKVRNQFGRPIGSFQAVKHACADLAVQIAVSRQLVGAAVAAVADGDPSAHRAAIMAKAYASEAAVAVAGKAMQLHGGIGYTWEADVHRYLKRATLNRALFGTPAQLRRELTSER